ncbi:peptidylprolyl isomerase [Flavobacterium sp. MAH-1]|uniref:Peptidylprolyl isomerase n=1 Tax=Flavobacterium agri TaxID=2743471 RepID=A0A7Y9C876_9FLAO|nr:peptidylprolyl isomerase [Flavobacterium agri]NUY82113.1 peptidylprolyl isomerase [Flavobacterium agri]NYA72137.1 peptidylprolyl isomerase [Flavobacterium agri]
MKIKHLLFGLLLAGTAAVAQKSKKEVLFTINDKPYYTDEFLRVYNKNLDLVKDESQKDLDQYLELFIGYKLKINKANKLGLENGQGYQNELKQYRGQLAKGYLSDSKVTKELVDEAYQRSLKEVRASHILFLVDENASPADTLKAYNQALDVYKKAVAGEDFGKLAEQYSQDPSAKDNKGDLGFFSAFRMVYPFESGAFKTKVGEISKPTRSRFGYHVIKTTDMRDNRGDISVAHIMILKPKTDDPAEAQKAKDKIFDIYNKLKQGENFESLAKQFSDDKSSSSKGGVLNRFGSGQLSSEEFENAAFALTKDKPLSEPVQSQFGWHIIKFIDRYPIKTYDEMKPELENKVSKDDRSRLITSALNEKLHKKYSVKRNDKVYKQVVAAVTEDYYKGEWETPDLKNFSGKLFSIKDKNVTGADFLTFILAQQKAGHTDKPIDKLVDRLYVKFVNDQLTAYYNDHLEAEFPEFAAVMDEYRDGLLLFDLMEKEIWERSKTDTLGLKSFYEANKAKYQWKSRVDIVLASSTNQDIIKKAQKFLKENQTADVIKEKLNTKDKVNVMTSSGVFEEGNDALPKNIQFKEGVSEVFKDGDYYFVAKVNKVLPAGAKTLDEAKGRVINDYQQYLEENWVKELKSEFTVKVNRDVFEKVKKEVKS